MSDIFHLCDSGVISGASFWLWITQTSLNICTRVWLFFINSYICAYSSSPCVWIVIHQSTWHVNHHASVFIPILMWYLYYVSLQTNQVSTCHSAHHKQIKSQQVKSQCLTPVFILYSLSFNSLNHQKCTFFRGVVYFIFFRGDLHPRYCRGLSRGRRSVLLHCLQSLWLC